MPAPSPVPTHGLTHIALAVRDPERSLAFYAAVLGVVPVYRDANFVQAQTPGARDVIVFDWYELPTPVDPPAPPSGSPPRPE